MSARKRSRKVRSTTAREPKTATNEVQADPVTTDRTVVAAPASLLAGLVADIDSDARRASQELCAAARCLDRSGHEDGAQFLLWALGRLDALRMSAEELRGVLAREMKAEVQP